jgi:hypothetical protein
MHTVHSAVYTVVATMVLSSCGTSVKAAAAVAVAAAVLVTAVAVAVAVAVELHCQ